MPSTRCARPRPRRARCARRSSSPAGKATGRDEAVPATRDLRPATPDRSGVRVLILDNYDSFTYNLVQYLGELGAELDVVRNDVASAEELVERAPDRAVVSPGPCTPDEAGVSVAAIPALARAGIPVLGVCLGHQALA